MFRHSQQRILIISDDPFSLAFVRCAIAFIRYFKPVYKVDAEPPEPVVGIRIDRVTRGARPDEKKCVE